MRRKHTVTLPNLKATRTIILTDGDEAFLESIAKSLTDVGFTVHCAANGQQALQISKEYKGKIDVLVADAQLLNGDETSPSMTGIQLARHVHAQRPKTNILLMSEVNLETLVRSQGWEFIHRPFATDELKQKIDALIRDDLEAKQPTKLTETNKLLESRISNELWDRPTRWCYLRDRYTKLKEVLARLRT